MTEASSIFIIAWARYWRVVAFLVGVLTLITLLSLGGCGGGGEKPEGAQGLRPVSSSADFPVPPEILPNVNFWRNVYGVWGRNTVAFHDDEHMGVIYEVAQLPGATQEGYSEVQRAFVRDRLEYYKGQVRELERRLAGNQTLTAQDRALLAKFEQDGGARGVYGAAERVRSQRGLRDRFRRGLEISGRYDKAFRASMRAGGLPEDLAYLPHVESSFQTNAVSSAGATGVWQFMPATGRVFMHVNGAVDDRMDPILSADGAARYLAQAHNRLGSWPLAITSYNHGQGGMANAKAQFGQDFGSIVKNYQGKSFKFASRNYYAEFLAAREVAGHPERYFPEGVRYEAPWPHDRLVLASATPADQVARHYGVSTGGLAGLNLHWRSAARDGRTPLPAGSTVWLPAGSMTRVAGQPPAYDGSAMAARDTPKPMAAPMAAATAMAFQASEAEPAFADLPARRPAPAARPQSPVGPRLAMVEPKPAVVAPRPAAIEPKPAVAEPRPAAIEPKPVVVESRPAVVEPKPVMVEPGPARTEPRIALEEEQDERPEPRATRAQRKDTRAQARAAMAASQAAKAKAKARAEAEAIVARAEAKVEPKGGKADAKTAKAESKGAKTGKAESKAGKADGKPEAKTAKAEKAADKPAKYHVVKPQETLFRVASASGISVAELRRLNKLGPNDKSVRPGQKLKVGT